MYVKMITHYKTERQNIDDSNRYRKKRVGMTSNITYYLCEIPFLDRMIINLLEGVRHSSDKQVEKDYGC
jgi:hypothetical protein